MGRTNIAVDDVLARELADEAEREGKTMYALANQMLKTCLQITKSGGNPELVFDLWRLSPVMKDLDFRPVPGEYISWIENPEAYAIIFEKAGLSWTLSSEPVGYDSVNYGVWYDDIQLARIAKKHVEIARKLGVKRIVVGECGHATKALVVTAERLFTKENYIPRESVLPVLAEIIKKGKLDLDPQRNDFPVTLHDPCNTVRLAGIVEPQREVLRKIAPVSEKWNLMEFAIIVAVEDQDSQ